MSPLATYEEIANLLKMKKSSLYQLVCEGSLPRGCYLGHGRWNIDKVIHHIERGTLFQTKPLRDPGPTHQEPAVITRDDYKRQIRQACQELQPV